MTNEPTNAYTKRNLSLDLLRVLACLLVVWQHATEFYYIGDNGIFSAGNQASVIGWLNSLARTSVPLFVMLSGYFLLPMRDVSASAFFKKRFARVLLPFGCWCIAYAVYYTFWRGDSMADCLVHIAHTPINWGTEVGHLWYVYMIMGVYAIIPVISPWVRQCGKNEMRVYLLVWAFTTLLPYIHLVWPDVLGECSWNPTPTFYYFNGFAGFLLLGSYVRKYGAPSWQASAAMLVVGYVITAAVFNHQASVVTQATDAELSWNFCTINVAMMTLGLFGLISRVKLNATSLVSRIVCHAAVISYSVYLAHIMVLNNVHEALAPHFSSVAVAIPLTATITFAITFAIMAVCAKLPKAHLYLGT